MKTKLIFRKADRAPARTVFPGWSSPVRLGLIVLVGLQSACASAKDGVSPLPSPSRSLRVKLAKLAVVTGTNRAQFRFDRSKGRTGHAGDGAQAGAGAMMSLGSGDGNGAFLVVPFVALGAMVGAAHSSFQKMPASKLRECESDLVEAAAGLCNQSCIQEAFLKAAGMNPEQALPTGGVDYTRLLGAGFDTVLELQVDELYLHKCGASDASFRLLVNGRIRLVRTLDGQVLCDEGLRFRSGAGLFADWATDGAEPFRQVVQTAYRQMAESVCAWLGAAAAEAR